MEIINYQVGPSGGNIIAEFDIDAGEFVFHKYRLIRSQKGYPFVSGPSFSSTDPITGLKKYFPYIEIKDKKTFDAKIVELLKEYVSF